jgi:hypothetical protein
VAAQGEGAARVRGISGPDQEPRPNSLTRQLPTPAHEYNQNSTVLLANATQQFQTPKVHCPKEKQKKQERINSNFSSLQTGYHTLPPLKKNSTSNSDAFIGTTKARLMNQQNSHIMKSSATSATSAPQAPRILRYAADDTLESDLATRESSLARFDCLDSSNTSST